MIVKYILYFIALPLLFCSTFPANAVDNFASTERAVIDSSADDKNALFSHIRMLIMDLGSRYLPDRNDVVKKIDTLTGSTVVDGVTYSGEIEIYSGEQQLYTILRIPLEDYVKSVVMAELDRGWEYEALKVQAVLARTYAVNHIIKNRDAIYHITSSTLHQVYKNAKVSDMIASAVEETTGEILTYKGSPIEAYYHSTCGGKTEHAEEVFNGPYPYLRSVKNDCTLSPMYYWERKFSYNELAKALNLPKITDINLFSRTVTGRMDIISFKSGKIETFARAKDLRRILGWKRLPSTMFKIKKKESGSEKYLMLTGRGYGHGVGLCQWGTLHMAGSGKKYKEILAYYYPGTLITKHEDL